MPHTTYGKEIKFKQKLDKHEKETHIKGLKRLELPMPEGDTDSTDAELEKNDAEQRKQRKSLCANNSSEAGLLWLGLK